MRRGTASQHRPDRGTNQLVVFTLSDQRYGLPLMAVERIVRVVEVTPLPKAPDIVLGVVNVQGRVIPVINVRRRFHLPEREIALTDQMVIARTTRRSVALVVDSVGGVLEYSEQEAIEFLSKTTVPGIYPFEPVLCRTTPHAGTGLGETPVGMAA